MNIMVFDTETTSIEKPFVYNIGWCIYNTDTKTVVHKADYVVEQVWHNRELFTTAYYAEKREEYIKRMRGRTCIMAKLGYITQLMYRLIKDFEIEYAFAHNSPFDSGVFDFNCEWFKIINPFDTVKIVDIRGYAHKVVGFDPDYQAFCETHSLFTDKGNYSSTAESVYKWISGITEFIEEHTALADSEIELEILKYCVEDKGLEWGKEYKVYRSIPRLVEKTLEIKDTSGVKHSFPYNSITIYKEKADKTRIICKAKGGA